MGAAALVQSGVRQRLAWLSLTPFDQGTAEGRSQERHRRIALTAGAAAFAKLLSVGTTLISLPLTLHYLGAERFGMWITISSLIAMMSFADFGIANGVLSAVADAHGRDDHAAIQRIVSSGFFLLSGIAVVIVSLFAAVYTSVPWHAVFNVQGPLARAEAGPALAVCVACFAAAVPLSVVQRAQMGLQQGFVSSLWQCIGSVCGLVGVLIAIHLQGGLVWLVLALAGVPLAGVLFNSLHFYFFARPDLKPKWQQFSLASARHLAGAGTLFFVLQVCGAVTYTSDSIVIAQLLGASAVTTYAVPEKLFSLITVALTMAFAPLWPAYGEAIARGDRKWVRRTLTRTILIGAAASGLASLCLVWLAPTILGWWVGAATTPAFHLLVAFAVWKVIEASGMATAMFLNGARVMKPQVAVACATAIAAIGLKIGLVTSIGISGAVWATISAYLVFAVLPYAIYLPKLPILRRGTE